MIIPENADSDVEARHALWNAILTASLDVTSRFNIGTVYENNRIPIRMNSNVPKVATWQLVEALCLLGIIIRSEAAVAKEINIFGKTGPINITEDGKLHTLWAQQTLQGEISLLNGRPDLIVTSTSETPNSKNAIRIIEAKCVRKLDTQTVRSEFGKAHDLRVATYLIWSFYTPTSHIINGAKGLGINIESIGFDTEWRSTFIKDPKSLISRIAYTQEQTRKEQRFALALEAASKEAKQKLLSLPEN